MASVCWIFRYCCCSRSEEDAVFQAVLHSVLLVLERTDDVVCALQAFKAVEAQVSVLKNAQDKSLLLSLMAVCVAALGRHDPQLTKACSGAISALLDADIGQYADFYPQLSKGILSSLNTKTCGLQAGQTLIQSLARGMHYS